MSRRAVKLLLALTLAAATVGMLPSSAKAYVFISTDGCGGGRGAAWPANMMPGDWYLNSGGYSGLQFATLETTLSRSMDTWGVPCCSNWRHSYLGSTASTAMGASNQNVVEFEESRWPSELGDSNSVIAVTMPVPTFGCQLVSADMLFNGVGFSFRTSGANTDLESIATHEFGHWIGLDHTNAQGATMLAYYSGGSAERTLVQDDIDGACALYPRSCTGCASNIDCPAGQVCTAGTCEVPPCQRTTDCAMGTICSGGACLPGCRGDAECQAGYTCQFGSCQRPAGDCSICGSCSQNSDCGGAAYYCVDLGGATQNCTKTCRTDSDCDGDSKCWTVSDGSGNQYQLCFAPDAQDELCPASYVCSEAAVPVPGCDGLWDFCSADQSTCSADSDICVQTGATAHCSCTCATNADCGSGNSCITGAGGRRECWPNSVLDPCQNVSCRAGTTCQNGSCVSTDPCQGVTCATGETCNAGRCISACGDCPEGRVCDRPTLRCVFPDPCDLISCPAGRVCDPNSGTCVFPDPCDGVTCAAGEVCDEGICLLPDPCDGVSCDNGWSCVNGTCTAPPDPCAGISCHSGNHCDDGICVPDTNPPASGGSSGGAEAESSGCSAAGGSPVLAGLFLALGALASRRRRG